MSILSSTYPVPENFDPSSIRHVLAKQKRGESPLFVTVDRFPVFADDPLRDSHTLLDAYLNEVGPGGYGIKPGSFATGKAILDTPIKQWPAHLSAALARILFFWTWGVERSSTRFGGHTMWSYSSSSAAALRGLVDALLRRDPPFSERELLDLLEARMIGGQVGSDVGGYFRWIHIVRGCESFKNRHSELTPALRDAVDALRKWRKANGVGGDRKSREISERLHDLAGKTPAARKQLVEPGEPWAETLIEMMVDASAASKWEPLLQHCAPDSGSKPSGKWMKQAKKLIDAIGVEGFVQRASEWVTLAPKPRTVRLRADQIVKPWYVDYDVYSMKNEDMLKGLAWACAAAGDAKLSGPLGALAEACYKKIPNVGPRSPKVGNACLIALTMLPGQEPRAELSRLKARVKQPTARKMIDKALARSAEAAGMSTDDLEELAIGTYGLTEPARGTQKMGAFTCELKIQGSSVATAFIDAKGKSRASAPAELKKEFAQPLKQFQQNAKDLGKMLSATRDRLERLPMSRRELPVSAWRERYLNHPLVGTIARRLIWSFGEKNLAGAWFDGKIVDANGRPLKFDDSMIVRLWHPSGAGADTVLAWRRWLEKHQIVQPFKQAHREIYLLTDAERTTRTYSNRFAAHILRQHILAALCTQRGWKYRLMGAWDGGGETMPTIELPRWDLRVEFWVDASAFNEQTENYVLRYVSTDQVRFCRTGNAQPIPLADVPPLVFSEMMRDIDLFVGVASIGNDPNWHDAGDRIGDYWQDFSFGELGISAQARREVLDRLLPRLKIASRCSLKQKFLIVKGDLRTYKIHLGSGNILMEPNDQYLCIVANRSRSAQQPELFLPFEGDQTLSLILSKAFLLADDTKITDETITRQIAGRK